VAYLCLAASMSLVGGYVALSKPLVAVLPVFLLAWLRFAIGAVAMLGWLKKPAGEAPLSGLTKRLLFLESFIGNFMFSICMLYGVSLTSAVAAGVIMASIPAVVALMGWLFLGERVRARVWTAVAFGAAGMMLLSLSKPGAAETGGVSDAGPSGSQAWLGNLLVFAAVLCEAAYAVIGKKLTGTLGPKRISALINLWGLALMTPFGLVLALSFDFGSVANGLWLLLVFYALAASVWTVWLWMTGMRGVPASQGGVFAVMLPIASVLVGVVVLGESLSAAQALAFAMALAGVALATLPDRP
jgi:drug/metabolite transporter (DMT)-like permease